MARKTQPTGLRSALILLSLFLGALSVGAEDLEYEMELGGSLGTSFYLGDVNSTPFAHLSGMGGMVARRVFNPRMALKGNLSVAHLSGKSDGYFIPSDPNSGTAAGGEHGFRECLPLPAFWWTPWTAYPSAALCPSS